MTPTANSALVRALIFGVIAVMLAIFLVVPAEANMPPPQQFIAAVDKNGKAKGTLVIQSDNSGGPSGIRQRTGSEYDTQGYCHVVLDFITEGGTKGTFTLRGSPTGYTDSGPDYPFIDEIPPISVPTAINVANAYGDGKQKTIVAPLRHGVTFFEWTPSADSTGTLYVWATPIPCGVNTDGF